MSKLRENRCATCNHWDSSSEDQGICEAHPPVLNPVYLSLLVTHNNAEDVFAAADEGPQEKPACWVQPQTWAHWGCGEWKAKRVELPVVDVSNNPVLSSPVSCLSLSVRSRKCIDRFSNPEWTLGLVRNQNTLPKKIDTLGDIVRFTADELCGLKNFGSSCLSEVRSELARHGLKLKGDA